MHKDLVPNYMLLTSLQEAAKAAVKPSTSASSKDVLEMVEDQIVVDDDEEITSDVSLSGS